MKVWIDQEMCTGDGLCEEICSSVFILAGDGLAYVHEGTTVHEDPGGMSAMVSVPAGLEEDVAEAEHECPGECIHIVNA